MHLQAATGLLAIIVLLVVLNWFFHKMYWGGWIRMYNRKKKALLSGADSHKIAGAGVAAVLALPGFSSFYRDGFEVVLFLQSYCLKLGSEIILPGTLAGGVLTCIVAVINSWHTAACPTGRCSSSRVSCSVWCCL